MIPRSVRSLFLVAVLVCTIAIGAATIAASSGAYGVTSADSIDVPDQTVELDGDEFEITSVGHVTPGDDIDATTHAPDDEDYILYLYTSDGDRQDFSRMSGDDSASFATTELDPGTYVLVVRAEREYQALHPVVVAGYEATVDVPGDLRPGESFTATVDLDASDDAPAVDGVTVVRTANGEAVEEVDATGSDGSYEAELTAPSDETAIRLLTTALGEERIAITYEPEMLEITDTTLTPSEFEVSIDESASTTEIEENDTAVIAADITNAGDFTGDQPIELRLDGDTVDTTARSMDGSDTETVTLEYDTTGSDVGETLSFMVASDDNGDSIDVTVVDETDESNESTPGNEDSDQGEEDDADDNDETDSLDDSDETDDGSASNETDNETSTDGEADELDGNGTGTDDSSGTADESDDSDPAGGGSSDEADDGPLMPNTTDDDDASSASTPLTGIPHFIVALLVLAHGARMRK